MLFVLLSACAHHVNERSGCAALYALSTRCASAFSASRLASAWQLESARVLLQGPPSPQRRINMRQPLLGGVQKFSSDFQQYI